MNLMLRNSTARLPMIFQDSIAECGLACVAMIAGYHGLHIDLNTLRGEAPGVQKGLTLKDLLKLVDTLDLSPRVVKLEPDDLDKVQTPAILHWNLNHFVVLKSASKKGAIIHDPSLGILKVSPSTLDKSFTGYAIEISPQASFKPKRLRKRLRLSDLWSKISGLRRNLVQAAALTLMINLFVIALPYFMQLVVDDVLITEKKDLLIGLCVTFSFVVVFQTISEALRRYQIIVLNNALGLQLAVNLFNHLTRLPLTYFEARKIGDITSRFQSLKPIRRFVSEDLSEAIVGFSWG